MARSTLLQAGLAGVLQSKGALDHELEVLRIQNNAAQRDVKRFEQRERLLEEVGSPTPCACAQWDAAH